MSIQNNSQYTIAIIDDEKSVQMAFTAGLEAQGYQVISFADGADAEAGLKEQQVDLLIMDLRMPKVDGLKLSWKLRKDGNKTPILLCSAYIDPAILFECLKLGIIDFVSKPVGKTELQAKAAEILHPAKNTENRQTLRKLLIDEDRPGVKAFLKTWREDPENPEADPLIKMIDTLIQTLGGMTKQPTTDMIEMLTSDLTTLIKEGRNPLYSTL